MILDSISTVVNTPVSSVKQRDFPIHQGATIHSISFDVKGTNKGAFQSVKPLRVDYSFIARDQILKSGYGWVSTFEKSGSDQRQARKGIYHDLDLKVPKNLGDITLRVFIENFDAANGINVNIFAPYTHGEN